MTTNGEKSKGESEPPRIPVKDSLRAPLPKRFYDAVSVAPRGDGFAVLLDGRSIRTPGKRELIVPSDDLAAGIADEWRAQGERIDPATMPLTRIVNSALDAVEQRKHEVAEDIVSFASSDLLCYRAEAPEALVRRQAEAWNPILAWVRRELGAEFALRAGLMPIEQPQSSLDAVRRTLTDTDAITLAALHVLTTISGSALLAIAHFKDALTAAEAWAAATVDETWQRELWGHDAEAEALSAVRKAEFEAASRCVQALRSRR